MKKFIITLLVLLSLVICVVFGLPFLLSSDTTRNEFSKGISAVSGMNITLGGPVSFSVYPEIGLVANDVKLALPDGNISVSISEIISSIKLSSVLSGKIEVTGLSLAKPEMTIVASDPKSQAKKTTQKVEKKAAVSDPFVAAIDQLERLSLKKLSISNGTFISQSLNGSRSIITNINAILRAPDLEGPIDLSLSATKDNQNISLTAAISALRSILQRQPSKFELALKLDPAPHPVMADLTASGDVLLNEEGSYQIIDGRFTSLNQPLRLDAIYMPGERPYARLDLGAARVDLGIIQKSSTGKSTKATKSIKKARSDVASLDLSPLIDIDADVSIKIDSFMMDKIEAREISLGATLKNGALDFNLANVKIAEGSVAAKLSTDVTASKPEFRGSVSATALQISDFAR
ncbi:MAG: AsmA family protein, partial [Hyphomicrobiales bacterium]|nr:AsmA family protein [Hyphomicrobiales bacterium]